MKLIEKYMISEVSDDKNPGFLFSTTHTELLVKIAQKKIDPVMLAKTELANRGIGKSGKWVGHEKASDEWGVKI